MKIWLKIDLNIMKSLILDEMETNQYLRMLQNNVTSTYKKSIINNKELIDREAKTIASSWPLQTELIVSNRIDRIAEKNAFITLKDHKVNFLNDIILNF